MAFLIVPLVLFSFFVVFPVFRAAYYSLFRWNGMGPLLGPNAGRKTKFLALGNFKDILTDPIFWKAFLNNVKIIILSLVIELPIALLLALNIYSKTRVNVALRTVYFIPYVVSEVVAGTVWTFIYHPQYGLSNSFFAGFFPEGTDFAFLGRPETVFAAIFIVITWKYFGLYMILYIAGLQGISDDIREAAAIDGASPLQLNVFIILPLLVPALSSSVTFNLIGGLKLYDVIIALTDGGPAKKSNSLATYIANRYFDAERAGYAAAVGVFSFVMIISFIIDLRYVNY